MESSSSIGKREVEKEKKGKGEKKLRIEDEVPPRKLNEGLIEHMDFARPKSRRSKFLLLKNQNINIVK